MKLVENNKDSNIIVAKLDNQTFIAKEKGKNVFMIAPTIEEVKSSLYTRQKVNEFEDWKDECLGEFDNGELILNSDKQKIRVGIDTETGAVAFGFTAEEVERGIWYKNLVREHYDIDAILTELD